MTIKTTDAATLAGAFGVTVRRVQQLATDGVLPKAGRGKYDLVACIRAYLAHALSGASAANEPDDLVEARRLLLIEQTRRERRRNDIEDKTLWTDATVQDLVTGTYAVTVQRLEALPSRYAGRLAGMTDTALIRTMLRDEVHSIRTAMAQGFNELHDLAGGKRPAHCPVCLAPWKAAR